MQRLQVNAEGLEYVELHAPVVRVLVFVAGLLPLLAPYELLIQPHWTGFSPLLLFFAVISLGAVGISGMFLGSALLGRNQRLHIDPASGQIEYHWRTAFGRAHHAWYPLADIRSLAIHTHERESRADSYALELCLADGLRLRMGDCSQRATVEGYRQMVEGWQSAA